MQSTHLNARSADREGGIEDMFNEIPSGFDQSNSTLSGSTYMSRRPPTRNRIRPLPQPPGASQGPGGFTAPALPSLPASMSMPIPEPFQHPGPPASFITTAGLASAELPQLSQPNPSTYNIPTVHGQVAPNDYQASCPSEPPPGVANSNSLDFPEPIYRNPSPQPSYDAYNGSAHAPSNANNSYDSNDPLIRTTSCTHTNQLYPSSFATPTLSLGLGANLGPGSASSSMLSGAPINRTNPKSSNWSANSDFLHRNNYSGSVVSYNTATGNDGAGCLDLPPASWSVADIDCRGGQQYFKDPEVNVYGDEDKAMFANPALLSHLAAKLRDTVPRSIHDQGSTPYVHTFTGKDIVSTIQSAIQLQLADLIVSINDRRTALQVAQSLQNQLFFRAVEWGGQPLRDGVEDVYMFPDEQAGGSRQYSAREELPSGVITLLTSCYSPCCARGLPGKCYTYSCSRRYQASAALGRQLSAQESKPAEKELTGEWMDSVDPDVVRNLPESERRRQEVIWQVVKKEEQYVNDLDTIVEIFIKPLRETRPPLVYGGLSQFIDTIFWNILKIRRCNRRLLEAMRVRQREQQPVIQHIGDIFLTTVAEFRTVYPSYIGQLPIIETLVKDESDSNAEFRNFLEHRSRDPRSRRLDLKYFLHRPQEHLTKYTTILETILHDTEKENADAEYLAEAMASIKNLHSVAQLWTFQNAMCRGNSAKLEWHNLVSEEVRDGMSKQEVKRQSVIFELIKGEMEYVKDLDLINTLFIQPLVCEDPPPIHLMGLERFISEVFSNLADVHLHHRRMLDRLHEIQREEYPIIRSISAPVFDAALNWRDAYMIYVPHYPVAEYLVDSQKAENKEFKGFIERQIRVPDSRRLELKAFIHRPVARLPRYELLLRDIMAASPMDHEDRESIPQIIEAISELNESIRAAVGAAKQKVEIWNYASNLVWKPGETIDLDLHNESRQLYHFGKLYHQPEGGLDFSRWSEVFVLVFDNYLLITKPRVKDGVTKYHVNRRPIPVQLLNLIGFNDPAQQRSTRLFSFGTKRDEAPGGSGDTQDSRFIYTFGIRYSSRAGGISQFFTDSLSAREEWKQKLEEAIGMREVIQDSSKDMPLSSKSSATKRWLNPRGAFLSRTETPSRPL